MQIKRNEEQLKEHFNTQLRFIEKSLKEYDIGHEEEAQRIATNLRILLHDTQNSASLLKLLDLKSNLYYISSIGPYFPINMLPYNGLTSLHGDRYSPLCKGSTEYRNKWLTFRDWWNELVIDDKSFIFTRKDIVLTVANKDGGAHIDEKINQKYWNLAYNNSLGWKVFNGTNEYDFINNVAYASIYQIASELLVSVRAYQNIIKFERQTSEEFTAFYINDDIYLLNSSVCSNPIGSKLVKDERVNRKEIRKSYADIVTFRNNNKSNRFVIV